MAQPKPPAEFVFRVRRPSARFGLGRFGDGSPNLDLDIHLQAVCLAPPAFAGRDSVVRLYARDRGVGDIFANKSVVQAIVYLPMEMCWQVAAAVNAGTISFVTVSGPPLFRSTCEADAVYFEGPRDEVVDLYRGKNEWGRDR